MMAGGAELEQLSHELARQLPDSELAREMESDVAVTLRAAEGAEGAEQADEVSESTRP
jgi:hypothetical protein